MRSLGCSLLAVGLLVAAAEVRAEEPKLDTTADLVAYCDTLSTVDEVQEGQDFCDGFIAGSGLLYLELVRAGRIAKIACADPIPTVAEAREAFVTWATAHPEHMQAKPIDGLWRAMAETYPCPK